MYFEEGFRDNFSSLWTFVVGFPFKRFQGTHVRECWSRPFLDTQSEVEKPVALVSSQELLTGSCQTESECVFSQDLQVVSGQ